MNALMRGYGQKLASVDKNDEDPFEMVMEFPAEANKHADQENWQKIVNEALRPIINRILILQDLAVSNAQTLQDASIPLSDRLNMAHEKCRREL